MLPGGLLGEHVSLSAPFWVYCILGAVVGGFLVGLVEAYGQAYAPSFAQVVIFVLMAVVVLVRPSGPRHVAKRAPVSVAIVGEPGELLMHAHGRTRHALVTFEGQPDAVALLHEETHAPAVYSPGTQDNGYGYSAASSLTAARALANADSYALYANGMFSLILLYHLEDYID